MRIKNKEIRRRRQRKEQKIKEADRAVRAQFSGDKKSAPTAAAKPKVAAAPAKKAADNKSTTAETKVATPKKAPKKKAEADESAPSAE